MNLNDAQIKETNDRIILNEFIIDVDGTDTTFKRRKIKSREYDELEDIRAKFAESTNATERRKLNILQYRKAASYYLGMTDDQFEGADYEELKRIIDAQNLRTNYGRPNPMASSGSSTPTSPTV